DELHAIIRHDASWTVSCRLGEVVEHARLVHDEVRELTDLEPVILGAGGANDVAGLLRIWTPEVHIRNVVRLSGDPLGEAEGLEGLDAARLNTVGLPERKTAVSPLDNAGGDIGE